ncbi:hypothetical protein BGZ99_007247 [Dissophora globulifera]|uniref:Uncharacterized protein n=1 Tax=Dissophora globulifera TaxID=979702 RepID=A0A9P6RAB6_9FUNG|nr:hypothetical protein BGZ99_007247 [Dissophora globulifera]
MCLWTRSTVEDMIALNIVVAIIPGGDSDRWCPELGQQLSDLVLRHQVHNCGHYCLVNGQCRFKFPKAASEEITFFDQEANVFVYQRGPDDGRINPYNEDLLRFGQCNMDLQYSVGDKAKHYLCKYTTKGGLVLSGTVMGAGAESTVSIVYKQLGMMDIVYDILGHHLHRVSTSALFLPTDTPETRMQVLRMARQLQVLGADSTDLFMDDKFKKYNTYCVLRVNIHLWVMT